MQSVEPFLIPLKASSLQKFHQILPKSPKVLIFDIDNTLYCESTGLEAKIITQFLQYAVKRGIPQETVVSISKAYSEQYGLAFKGFLKDYPEIDVDEFESCVDGSITINDYLKVDDELVELLEKCEYKMYCFTNANYKHAMKVLKALNITKYMSGVFYCEYVCGGDFLCKPSKEAYEIVEGLLDGCTKYFWDDNARNVEMAMRRGWYAYQVNVNQNIKSMMNSFYLEDVVKVEMASNLVLEEINKRFVANMGMEEYEDEVLKENKVDDK